MNNDDFIIPATDMQFELIDIRPDMMRNSAGMPLDYEFVLTNDDTGETYSLYLTAVETDRLRREVY